MYVIVSHWVSQVALVKRNLPVREGHIRGAGSVLAAGRSPGGEPESPPLYSCLGNPMDRETLRATVNRVTERQTELKWLGTHVHLSLNDD